MYHKQKIDVKKLPLDIDTSLTAAGGVDSEQNLVDEDDMTVNSFKGTLSFNDGNTGREANLIRDVSANSITMTGATSVHLQPNRLEFEIAEADIVKDGRSKYVVYTVMLVHSGGLDSSPALVEKRYSDFRILNTALQKYSPEVMKDIVFPKKILTGNFKPSKIAERSRAFEQYMTHVYSEDILRLNSIFTNFFYGSELKDGYFALVNGHYDNAIKSFKTAVHLQKKLLGVIHPSVVAALCAIVCSCHAIEQENLAQAYADLALKSIDSDENSPYLVPLLQLVIRICWTLGKDKKDLEDRLRQLGDKGISIDGGQTLLEVVLNCRSH